MWRTLRGCAAQLSPPRFDMIVSVNWKAIWLWRLWSKLWASPDDYELHSHVQKCVTFCFQFNIALADYELHSLNLLSISPSTESMAYCLFFCFFFFQNPCVLWLLQHHSHRCSQPLCVFVWGFGFSVMALSQMLLHSSLQQRFQTHFTFKFYLYGPKSKIKICLIGHL